MMFPGLKIVRETEFENLTFLSCQKRPCSLKSKNNSRLSLTVQHNRQSNTCVNYSCATILSKKEGVLKTKH
jgi:hypothetical protein